MTSWAFYRHSDGKFVPENVDTRLCTHVIYAYASLSPDDLIAKEFDPWADITNSKFKNHKIHFLRCRLFFNSNSFNET